MENYSWLSEVSSLKYGLKYHIVLWECGKDEPVPGMFRWPFDEETDKYSSQMQEWSSVVCEPFVMYGYIWDTPVRHLKNCQFIHTNAVHGS